MPRKSKHTGELGRALIHQKFAGGKKRTADNPTTALHVMESDGLSARDLKLKSVVEMNDLSELLTMAELAERDFTADKLQSHFVVLEGSHVIGHNKPPLPPHMSLLPIPKRPAWKASMTAEEVDSNEREKFVEWRRALAQIEETYDVVMTPFEKNLEVWRQLWRVVERSDVLVQVLDARNPLLYRCLDLEKYVKESGSHKKVFLLLNKADLLPPSYREHWSKFWNDHGVNFVFFSAVNEQEKIDAESHFSEKLEKEELSEDDMKALGHSSKIFGSEMLLDFLTKTAMECFEHGPGAALAASDHNVRPTIGFVGFPNVGKSSTLNVLCGERKVGVGPTPGKTKHFQTILLNNGVTLCDCPGLVFPSVVISKEEMVCGGVLPIDNLRNHVGPVQLVASRIPREILERFYGIVFAELDPDHPMLTASDVLQAHAIARGYMTQHGAPDEARSARVVLKDYVHGRLAFASLPPNADRSLLLDMYRMMRARIPRNDNDVAQAAAAAAAATTTTTTTTTTVKKQPTAKKYMEDNNPYADGPGFGYATAGSKKKTPKPKGNRAEKAWARAEAQGMMRPTVEEDED